MATVIACGGFGAICGSSIATSATMTKVAYPSMREAAAIRDELAAGSIAAGGTLGILIPPSTIMVIYGIMTETSIGKLFAAGVLPGLVADRPALRRGAVHHLAQSRAGPRGERVGWRERCVALQGRLGRGGAVRASSWAASMAASSPPPKAPASARPAPSSSRCAPGADAEGPARGAGRERADDGDAVHDPGRRAGVHQLPQLHLDARRPEDSLSCATHRPRPG